MAKKATAIKLPPRPSPAVADAFVAGPAQAPERQVIKRLTIDLSPEGHKAFKTFAAAEGVGMVELVRQWIEEHVGQAVAPARAPEPASKGRNVHGQAKLV